jgi:hypothetical protein
MGIQPFFELQRKPTANIGISIGGYKGASLGSPSKFEG